MAFKIVEDTNGWVLADTDRDLSYTMDDLAQQRGALANQVDKLTHMPTLDPLGEGAPGGMRNVITMLEQKIRQLDSWIAQLVQRTNEREATRLLNEANHHAGQTPVPAADAIPDPLKYPGAVTATILGPHWEDQHGNFYNLETLRAAFNARLAEMNHCEEEIARITAELRWSTQKMIETSRAVAELSAAQVQSDLAHTMR